MLQPVRVYVVGGPGSGKSSLARALSERTGIEVMHLDDHWDRTFARDERGAITPEAVRYRAELVAAQARTPAWIVEGAEPPLLTALAAASDVIVWCDVSFAVAATRMVRRHVRAELAGSNQFPGYRRLWRFLRSVQRRYNGPADSVEGEWIKWTRAYVERAIRPYGNKTIRSRGGPDERALSAVLVRLGLAPGA